MSSRSNGVDKGLIQFPENGVGEIVTDMFDALIRQSSLRCSGSDRINPRGTRAAETRLSAISENMVKKVVSLGMRRNIEIRGVRLLVI